jgi:hypothetical protein
VLIIWKGIPYATQEAGNLGLKKSGGACCYLDGFDTGAHTTNDATFGGLIGMLLGIIGGPIGVLLGGSYGTLVGATVDAGDAVYGASMLDQMEEDEEILRHGFTK